MTTIKNMAYWRSKNNVKSDGSYDGGELKANRSPMRQQVKLDKKFIKPQLSHPKTHFETFQKNFDLPKNIINKPNHRIGYQRIVDNPIPRPPIQSIKMKELPRMKKIEIETRDIKNL